MVNRRKEGERMEECSGTIMKRRAGKKGREEKMSMRQRMKER